MIKSNQIMSVTVQVEPTLRGSHNMNTRKECEEKVVSAIEHYAMNMYDGVDVYIHICLIATLDGG
jgi:hypothetical protein